MKLVSDGDNTLRSQISGNIARWWAPHSSLTYLAELAMQHGTCHLIHLIMNIKYLWEEKKGWSVFEFSFRSPWSHSTAESNFPSSISLQNGKKFVLGRDPIPNPAVNSMSWVSWWRNEGDSAPPPPPPLMSPLVSLPPSPSLFAVNGICFVERRPPLQTLPFFTMLSSPIYTCVEKIRYILVTYDLSPENGPQVFL